MEKNDVYKCNLCGNIVELAHVGGGQLVCCGQPMEALEEKTSELEGNEKHVPVVEKTEKGVLVKVGSVAHPMEDDHFIEFIELIVGDRVLRKYLKPGDAPEALFCVCSESEMTAREYCTKHGLWKS